MPKLIILGSSYAVPNKTHENTHMAVVGQERTLMIDCVNNPIVRLQDAGIPFNSLTDIIMTHFHPDHISGVPLLLMDMWLLGRRRPLTIYGLAHVVDRMVHLMNDYGWQRWPNFYPVEFHRIPEQEMTPVMSCDEFRVFTSPVKHFIPNIGVRVDFPLSRKSFAYSSDTEPCPAVIRLAQGVDMLFHEATVISIESTVSALGHSSAYQAGEIAREAGVKLLYLIHYPSQGFNDASIIPQAQKVFDGVVRLAVDLMEIEF